MDGSACKWFTRKSDNQMRPKTSFELELYEQLQDTEFAQYFQEALCKITAVGNAMNKAKALDKPSSIK